MAIRTSNGAGGGNWSSGSTWDTKPVVGDSVVIQSGDTVYIDENFDVGDGTDSLTYFAIDCSGNLVVRNRTSDAAVDLTLAVKGGMQINYPGRFFVGTEDSSLFGAESMGPIPSTRKINWQWTNDYTHRISLNNHNDGTSILEFWGAENYHQAAPDAISGQTANSGTKVSLTDSSRVSDSVNWVGGWLEVTAGTNLGQKREVTAFDNGTGLVSWSVKQPMPVACDSTTVYSLTHNYHRALLAADASAGSDVTITLDRDADWEQDDEIVLAVGVDYEQQTERPERVTIKTKNSASSYVVDLTYNHKAGDICIHLDKNIVFESTDTSGSLQGYYFQIGNSTGGFFKSQWVFFDTAGGYGSGLAIFEHLGSYLPVYKNCTAYGWRKGTADADAKFLDSNQDISQIPDPYQIEELHGYNLRGIMSISGTRFVSTRPIGDKLDNMIFRNFTMIGMTGSNYAGIWTEEDNGFAPKIYNVWITGRPEDSSSVENGRAIQGGTVHVDGFKFYQIQTGFYIECAIATNATKVVENFEIRNGLIHFASERGILFFRPDCGETIVENVDFKTSTGRAIDFDESPSLTVYLINNKYNNCAGGLYFVPQNPIGKVFEYNGEYGVEEVNSNYNLNLKGNLTNEECGFTYLSHNTKYVGATSPIWNEFLINKVVDLDDGAALRIKKWRSMNSLSKIELDKPTIDGTPYDYQMGLVHVCTLVDILEHPTEPRASSNIKMKIQPYAALGSNHANFADPFTFYATEGQTITVSVYFRKNISQLAGYTPRLSVLGCGHYRKKQMTDAVDTWEQVTIGPITARSTGVVVAWISCYNNLKYAKDDLNGWLGEPEDQGTVVVYADELDITVT